MYVCMYVCMLVEVIMLIGMMGSNDGYDDRGMSPYHASF